MAKGHTIHDDAAYNRAIQARIKANARTGRERRWLAEDPSRAELIDKLRNQFQAGHSSFYNSLYEKYEEWGTLTPNQEAALRKSFAQDAERKTKWKAERETEAANSEYFGAIGSRQVFELPVAGTFEYTNDYGYVYGHIFKQGPHVFLYKGTKRLGNKGDVVKFKATIKKHEEREGVKQTILTRPVVQE